MDVESVVGIETHDISLIVDSDGFGCNRIGHVKVGEGTLSQQKPVDACTTRASTPVPPHNIPSRINALCKGVEPSRRIDGSVAALAEQKRVEVSGDIRVLAHDVSSRIDTVRNSVDGTGIIDGRELPLISDGHTLAS